MDTTHGIKVYSDIDAHVEEIVEQEEKIKAQQNKTAKSTQRELNYLARDKALHVRNKKLEFHNDPDPRASWLEWCKDVANVNKAMADYSYLAGELLGHSKFLSGLDIGVRPLAVIASKKFNKAQMTAFQQFCIKQDKPLSELKIHQWAFEEYEMPVPPKVQQYIDQIPAKRTTTMTQRLKKNYGGYALLGLSEHNTLDVVAIVSKHWLHKYHPDKGGSNEDFSKINNAVEGVKDNGR